MGRRVEGRLRRAGRGEGKRVAGNGVREERKSRSDIGGGCRRGKDGESGGERGGGRGERMGGAKGEFVIL